MSTLKSKESMCDDQDSTSIIRGSSREVTIKWKKGLEISILCIIILVTWGLLAIPTVLYALPPLIKMPNVNDITLTNGTILDSSKCGQPIAYNGKVCLSELQGWQECFSKSNSTIQVPSSTNQSEAEVTAGRLLGGLPLLSPSLECEAAIKPFLCLFLFGSCDSTNKLRQVTQTDCLKLRDEVCVQEWELAETFLGQGVLPDCSSLPRLEEEECLCVNISQEMLEQNVNSNLTSTSEIECAEGYYLSNNGSICRPLCTLWTSPPGVSLDSDSLAVIISMIIALLSSTALFILAFSIQRSTMLTFPTLYLVYTSVTVNVIALLFLIEFLVNDKEKLFCSSKDLIASFQNETIFCTIIGVSFTYAMAQLGYWTAFHAICLCWGIVFPFHYRRIKKEDKVKYVHITTVLLALLLPTIPALLHLKDGYTMTDTPTTLCTGRNGDVTYFALILPSSCGIAVSTLAFVIISWTVLKEFVFKKQSSSPRLGMVGKLQAKLLFIVFYYIIVGTVVLTIFTYFEITDEADREAIEQHFVCQSTGLQPDKDCGSPPDVHLEVFNSLSGVAIVLIGLLPAVILGFTGKCDCNKYKSCVKWVKK